MLFGPALYPLGMPPQPSQLRDWRPRRACVLQLRVQKDELLLKAKEAKPIMALPMARPHLCGAWKAKAMRDVRHMRAKYRL